MTLDLKDKNFKNRRENSETTTYQSEPSTKVKNLEIQLKQIQDENEFLKKYNQKLKMDADCIELGPKIQNSFYQNIFINDMKRDIHSSNEEVNKYRLQITELKGQVEKLTQRNEYLNKLVKKYRETYTETNYHLQEPKISVHLNKGSPFRLKNSVELDNYLLDSKESTSSIPKQMNIHHAKSESLISRGGNYMNVLEHLHSTFTSYDNSLDLTD